MPELSRFLGIVVVMYYRDHDPARVHVKYGDYEFMVELSSGAVSGSFPRRSLCHLLEWYELHSVELLESWDRAKSRERLVPIAPLEW